jgi:hypothetical protein
MGAPSESRGNGSIHLTQTKGDRRRDVTRIGLDIAKNVFQAHGVEAQGKVVVRK